MRTPELHTITATEMRAINRSAILELIRTAGPLSRTDIGSRLQVSLPTVMRIVDDLVEEGLARPSSIREWTGGRKRALVEFNGSSQLVIGLDLGGTKLYGAVVDLAGQIRHEITYEQHKTQADESFLLIGSMIDELLGWANGLGIKVLGIGVGVPGVVQPASGLVDLAPSLDWSGYPLTQKLASRFQYPIVIENDVNLAALGEAWFGAGTARQNLVLIAIGTGIGAGVVIDGAIFPGAHAMAGEIGYLLPDRSNLGQSFPRFGALESLASGTGIAARARQASKGQIPDEVLERLTAEDVFTAGRNGKAWALPILADTVDYLAQSIAAINQILDPELILLGGGVARSADLLIEPILNRLRGTLPRLPRLEASRLGVRAGVMGSIIQLLRVTSNHYQLHRFGI